MTLARTVNPVAAKVARVALVFLLVFWSSFRVEYALALQGMTPEGLDGHEAGTLDGLTVYAVDRDDASKLGGAVWSVEQAAGGGNPSTVQVTAGNEPAMFVASARWNGTYPHADDGAVVTANFVEWAVDGAVVASADGVLKLDVSEPGTRTVTCRLKAGDEGYLAESFTEAHAAGDFKVEFTVQVAAPPDGPGPDETPSMGVNPIEILGPDGAPITNRINVDKDASIQLDVRLSVVDSVTNEVLHTYQQSTSESGLADLTGDQLTDVTWSLSDEAEGVAEIDPATGLLTTTGDGEFAVTCSVSPQRAPTQFWSATARVKVGAGKVEDPQGDDHSDQVQTLTVVADLTALQEQDDEQADEDGDEGEAPEGEKGGDEGDAPDEMEPREGQVERDTDGNPADEEDGPGNVDEPEQAIPTVVQKTYTVDELAAKFEQGTGTYTMPSAPGPVTVTGSGVWLADILQDAGIDVEAVPIESVDFVTYTGEAVTVSWSELASGNSSLSSVLVASASRVTTDSDQQPEAEGAEEAEEAEDGESPDPEDDEAKLLPNTRFRILFDTANSAIDASALRYISTIRVNPKVPEPSRPPAKNDVFSVSVSYVPVPVGVTAVLVAVPSHTINGRWDCVWEESADGKSWTVLENSAVQTLYIPTTSDRLGHQFRVTIDTNIKDDETGDLLSATSEPITLQEGSGFSVVLKYNPPVAGDMAKFQSEVLGYEGAIGNVTYKWEWTEDGGANWATIDDSQTGATLHLPTEAVSEDELVDEVSSSEASEANLIYIRVSASAPDPDHPGARLQAVSNMQPLTVRVGETGTDGGTPDAPPDLPGGGDSSTTPGADGDEGAAADPTDTATAPAEEPPTMTEVDSFIIEDAYSGSSAPRTDFTSDTNPADTPDPSSSPTDEPAQEPAPSPTVNGAQIYINEQVSAQVVEQQQAAEQYVTATQPGARWTSLNTVAPKGDEVSAVLANNPFAPFVLPFALGITASGVVEKLVAFRRQLL